MQVKISNWFIFGALILIGVLIVSLIRGCDNFNEAKQSNVNLAERIKVLQQDSLDNVTNNKQYEVQSEYLASQLETSNDSIKSLNEDLRDADKRIATLLKTHQSVSPNADTNITTVPNRYITDCADCFAELGNGQKLVLKYKLERDNQERIYKAQLEIKNNRINNLQDYSNKLYNNYKNLLDSSGKKLEQRGILFFKMSALAINQNLPNAGGAGFIYMDKKKRLFGVSAYLSNYGSVYQAEIAFPLSLKKL